ncbi:o-succinylbenzoate synthase [Jiangella muralis]|uniref:o-succinylbenzoate synthase n=1 Tax=Jiangella muralis TaxID=702383 RepID=UPI00069F5253|nr:o-succinylbenzoate synthase [Jiangella muralis]
MITTATLEGIELRRLRLPLVAPFRTSFGTQTTKDVLILRAVTSEAEGWGECVAAPHPLYASEYVEAAMTTLREFLVPALSDLPHVDVNLVAPALARFRGHRMSKAALEMAVWDAELRGLGVPLSRALGAVATSVPAGVSVGIMDTLDELVTAVGTYLADGYRRIKLKIEPGWDVSAVAAIRDAFGDVALQVDANTAYTLADVDQLRKLDDFGLLLIEQPMAEEDVLGHAELARHLRTPICLDESITSARAAADAIRLGACRVVNIKAGRVGGYLEARRVHDVCRAHDVPVWCGGMVETGLGRAANAALAALPGMLLPGDVSASSRFYRQDITPPLELHDGFMPVPTGPGLGVEPDPEILESVTVRTEWLPLG